MSETIFSVIPTQQSLEAVPPSATNALSIPSSSESIQVMAPEWALKQY